MAKFMRGPDGESWCVLTSQPQERGDTVEVERRDGKTTTVKLGSIVGWIWEVVPEYEYRSGVRGR